MLRDAFFESRNYRELVLGTDFRFVVGRRGTGKSALFDKVSQSLRGDKHVVLTTERPAEETVTAWHSELQKLTSEYLDTRRITRLAWRVQILTQVLEAILGHYKANRLSNRDAFLAYRERYAEVFTFQGLARSLRAFREVVILHKGVGASALPEKIAEHFQVNWLGTEVTGALEAIGLRAVFMYDGLDEGWLPNQVATGLLGGLAKVAAEFREVQGVHCILFVRDNMFRALAEFDGDFSRNIEGNTLRLHWDEESLLSMVALRLRAAFSWANENSVKAWDRFAKRGLEGKQGFRKCLKLTLYRPRDVIALLNGAYQVACAASRSEIIDADIEATATRISQTRLNDLCKEYEKVLPGLRLFAESFRGHATRMPQDAVMEVLAGVVAQVHEGIVARDFALIGTAPEAFSALFSVGFLGIQDLGGQFQFCHDGSNAEPDVLGHSRMVVVHPCYWRALSLRQKPFSPTTVPTMSRC
jgi:hypothetical protein